MRNTPIIIAAVIDTVLIGAGVAAYMVTESINPIIVASVIGGAVVLAAVFIGRA